MNSPAPAGYRCPFCVIAASGDNPHPYTQQSDVVYRTEHVTAFINARWWPNNPGHVLVIPNHHIENIYPSPPTSRFRCTRRRARSRSR